MWESFYRELQNRKMQLFIFIFLNGIFNLLTVLDCVFKLHVKSCSEFGKEKDRVESRAGFLLLKEEQKLEREMNGYMDWICRAGRDIYHII